MNYNIYLDESGNTGNIELKENLQWNYGNQPYFALGSFYIEENISNNIKEGILEILSKYDPKLGIENELKSKANYTFKNGLIRDITQLLCDNNAGFYFDIANKKYKVIMNIVEYCVYPYFVNEKYISDRNRKVEAANFLYNNLKAEEIKMYIDLCQDICEEEEKITRLMLFLEILKDYYILSSYKFNPIEVVITTVKNHKEKGIKTEHLFPIKDFNNKGVKESFLPNVDAYNNIILSIGNLRIKKQDIINIYHDEQKQFSDVLKFWTDKLKNLDLNINNLNFCISKEDVLVQVADFYTGNLVRLYRKIIEYKTLDRNDREFINIIKPLLCSCNIVAPMYEQKEFFKQIGIKMKNTPIPFNGI